MENCQREADGRFVKSVGRRSEIPQLKLRPPRIISFCRSGLIPLSLALQLTVLVEPAGTAQGRGDGTRESPVSIEAAWDRLLVDVIPQAPIDPALGVPQVPTMEGAADDFLRHFYFESITEYTREETSFSGEPTATHVIDADPQEVANREGIPFRGAFQPNSDRIYAFLNWGTRGWLSPRISTDFSLRYRQGLSHVTEGSPQLSLLNTFGANRRMELLSASVEVNGLAKEGWLASSRLRLGRQSVYGAEWAALDGAELTLHRPAWSLTLFGGRRFTYYSNPDQRAIGGANLLFRLPGQASLEYRTLYYVRGSHTVTFRKQLGEPWFLDSYFKWVGSSPVDLSAYIRYVSRDRKNDFRFGFLQKLSDDDFFYDYTFLARDKDEFNQLSRLNLEPISPFSQLTLEAHRHLTARIRAGGAVVIRRLNDSDDQGPFNVSFEDYRFNAQTFLGTKLETFFEFHQRNSDRRSPLGVTRFDDVSIAGETRLLDLRAELRYSPGESGLTVHGGGFYSLLSMQDRFVFLENARLLGVLGGLTWRINQHSRIRFDYGLDDDFFVFRPSIKRGQTFRLRLEWRY